MLGREVWGWRTLVALLVLLMIPTIPHLDMIEDEWRTAIESTPESDLEPDTEPLPEPTQEPQEDEESAEDTDGASAEAEVSFNGDEPPAADQEERAAEPGESPAVSNAPDWVMPATQVIALTLMAIMAVGLLTSATMAVFASEAARVGILLAILGPLIAITQRGEGGIFTRGRLLGFVEAHPGIHFSALRDALELGNGVTAHHIQVLEKEGRVISWLDGRVRRFASSGIDQRRLKEIQSPITGMQVAILQVLSDSGSLGIKSGELRIALETSRQLLSYHMKQLSEKDLVKSTGKGRAVRWSLLEEGRKQLESSAHLADV